MERDRKERTESELKSESCPALSRQSPGRTRRGPSRRGAPRGRGFRQEGSREAAVFSFFEKSREHGQHSS